MAGINQLVECPMVELTKKVDFLTYRLTFSVTIQGGNKAYSCQPKWISPIALYYSSDCLFRRSPILFVSSLDVVNQEFIAFTDEVNLSKK